MSVLGDEGKRQMPLLYNPAGSHSAFSSPFGIIGSKPNSEQAEWGWMEPILRGGVLGIHGL